MKDLFNKLKLLPVKYKIVGIVGVLFIGLIYSISNTPTVSEVAETVQPSKSIATKQTSPVLDNVETAPTSQTKLYTVTKVIDGDTINVSINGKTETLRLIGIDTPETVDPRKPVQCFGIEASNKAKSVLSGKKVLLESDNSQGERDKYDRLLRYVFLEDGTNFNLMMVKEGYAHEYTYNLPYKYRTEFKNAEKVAMTNKAGLWGDICQTQTTPPTVTTPTQTSSNIICSSNVYNCTDFTTHTEAQTVYEQCGGVNNDIHKLDQDKDGQACESLP